MTAVKIKGTFSKTERDSNGLEDISNDLVKNEFSRYLVVGMVEQHKVTKEPGESPIPTARFVAIEVARGDDEEIARAVLDRARKGRGMGNIADTLLTMARDTFDFDRPAAGEERMEGQTEIRVGADGEHEVPEASGEEILAEREEAKAAEAASAEPDRDATDQLLNAVIAEAPAPEKPRRGRKPTDSPFTPDGGAAA